MPKAISRDDLTNGVMKREIPFLLIVHDSGSDDALTCYDANETAAVATLFAKILPAKPALSKKAYWDSVVNRTIECQKVGFYRVRPASSQEKSSKGLHPSASGYYSIMRAHTSYKCMGTCADGCDCEMFDGNCECVEHENER